MPRVLEADELRGIPWGHGWIEYRPDPEDGPEIPWEEYLLEAVWIQGDQMTRDRYGRTSLGAVCLDDYGRAWRMWDIRPAEGLARETEWPDA